MPNPNRSSAVMQQRNEPADSLDDFPTPPWATRAMCYNLSQRGLIDGDNHVVREPAANRGYMVKALEDYFPCVQASDIYDYGVNFPVKDYLEGYEPMVDWVITNPPFKLGEQFINKALSHARCGVAVILRSAFLEGVGRYERLYRETPPSIVLQHAERVPMVRGGYDPDASSATAYAWLVWDKNHEGPTILDWIPQCKTEFWRDGDENVYNSGPYRT